MIKKYTVALGLIVPILAIVYAPKVFGAPAGGGSGGVALIIKVAGYTPNSKVTLTSDRHGIGNCGMSIDIAIGADGTGSASCASDPGLGIGPPDGTDIIAPDGTGITATWGSSPDTGICNGAPQNPSVYCVNMPANSNPATATLTVTYGQGAGTTSTTCGQVASTNTDVNGKCVNSANDPSLSGQCSSDQAANGCGIVHKYIDPLIKFIAAAFGIIITILIIIGGIQYSSAGGDPQKVASAKKRIYNAIFALLSFGLLYAFLSFVIPGFSLLH